MFFRKKKIHLTNLPKHIAFIIDGNGRWAKKRGMPRSYGHKVGMNALINAINNSFDMGIDIVSVYCFSTENWNRPKDEVDYLFQLFEEFITTDIENRLNLKDIHLRVMGDYSKFNKSLVDAIDDRINQNNKSAKHVLNLGLNYGGRDEILRAVNNVISDKHKSVDNKLFEKYLYTNGLPDPDFIIRTGGELRLSNFMLWQHAYSELYFPKIHWPDFNKKQLTKSILCYQKRRRRFGAIKENK